MDQSPYIAANLLSLFCVALGHFESVAEPALSNLNEKFSHLPSRVNEVSVLIISLETLTAWTHFYNVFYPG